MSHSYPPPAAEAYEYLRDFAMHFEGDRSLAIRPNYSFSLALSALYRELQQQERQQQQEQKAAAAEARAAAASSRGLGLGSAAVGGSSKGKGRGGVREEGGASQAAAGRREGAQEQSALQLMVAAVLLHPSVVPRMQRYVKTPLCSVLPRIQECFAAPLCGAAYAKVLGVCVLRRHVGAAYVVL